MSERIEYRLPFSIGEENESGCEVVNAESKTVVYMKSALLLSGVSHSLMAKKFVECVNKSGMGSYLAIEMP